MFEAHVLHFLRKYLGEYVHGLSTEALRISVWKGDVVLKDLKLKAEALNSLKLPVTVRAGFVGTITLKVPWKSLGKEPVIVLIDRVFVLARPAPDWQSLKDEDREKIFEAKLQTIEEAELATLEAASRGSKLGSSSAGNSWLGSLIATIIGNLKITISNVHIRYEDCLSNPGHPFCSGITLAKLAAVTTDEHGNETFDTSGALDKLRKSLQLQRLAVYHDSDSNPWKIHKNWEDLGPEEWSEIFSEGIDESGGKTISPWAVDRKYLVSPINGVMKYHRLGKQERESPEIPYEKASLVIPIVSLTILEAQYYDGIKLLESLSRYRTRVEVSHLRPIVHVSQNPKMWWRYAMMATLQQKKMCYRFSWERIKHLCYLRRHYVQLYVNSLQRCTNENNLEMRQIERDLDSKVIILWRLLAHAKIESVKSKEATQRMGTSRKGWWSFAWKNSSGDASMSSDPVVQPAAEQKLTREEWQAINKMLSYEDDGDIASALGKDIQTMIQFLVDVSIEQAAARIISIDGTEILCGRFEQLNVIAKIYHKSIRCEVLLRFCGLSAPEGSLAQSVSSEKKENALAATFVRAPLGENIDWRLSATISPCHVTVLMESYERFLGFIKRSNAVSPTVALETATALQLKLEQVTRRAQEQLQNVLEEQSRFALDIDFDAPKVRIPFGNALSDQTRGNFLLDFGHFTVHTKENELDEQKQSIYSRFYISGRDIAAFFVDSCDKGGSAVRFFEDPVAFSCLLESNTFYSVIDRCRMSVVVDQIKAAHPSYPSTRISVQVPTLGIHFSPERYQRMHDLLNIFSVSTESTDHGTGVVQSDSLPWHLADLSCNARVLVWKGIGNSLAEWQPCFLVLSGLYLYVLDSERSLYYQRCCSILGRHVFEVPPKSVGGSLFALAISFRGSDIQKALESSSTLIIEFQDEVEKFTWLKGLTQATYRASAFTSMDVLGKSESTSCESPSVVLNKFHKADLVLNGSLVETKLSVYGKLNGDESHANERLVLILLAGGGKVNLVSGGDLTVKMKLHSFMIRDELQCRSPTNPQYLACSITKHSSNEPNTPINYDASAQKNSLLEEDDIFKDALPDFMAASDQSFNAYYLELDADVTSSLDEAEIFTGFATADGLNFGTDKITGKSIAAEIFYEAEDSDSSDFVSVTFISRYPDSPLYEGIDTQMSIRMAKLHFFCNRPTVVALINLGFDLSRVNSSVKDGNDNNSTVLASASTEDKREENGRTIIKGLLGYGKQRIVFNLRMDIDSVCVFLNKEDDSQLAMLVQESFLFDLKVHPSSTSIDGSLGNLRFCDMSLGPNHRWGWLCDILNQSTESLIKFTFQSFSAEDNDYEGYDYRLSGHLSAVRIVFLYRFIQEIMAYFMELATPHTEEVIKFVDKVGDFEWLIKKYEIDGASSLKLCLSLETPSIVVPHNSASETFMQLDLGQLQVDNSFSWHGDESDPSAVHLDVLHARIHGINMAVGVNGNLGNPMIRGGQGLEIIVRRSLRDVFRKVPTVSVEINVGLLHCVMSDKEYSIILDCAYTNISEEPNLPPSFRAAADVTKDSIRMLADKVNLNSQILLHRTVGVVVVDVQYALLELRNGPDGELCLAQILLESLWVSYRYTSLSEADLYVSIPRFSILDIRPDTKPEMRLMLGSYSDMYKGVSINCQRTEDMPLFPSDGCLERGGNEQDVNFPNITMLVMDCHWRPSSQSAVIRLQQPRVLVVPDFLLAVAEFFVPSLRTLTGREETLEAKNDPLTKSDRIIISESFYKQKCNVAVLSPSRQLIIDGPDFDEVIYDGCGGIIRLSEEDKNYCSTGSSTFIIIIGHGKKLRFKNVKIENAALLSFCTYLGNDSSYSVSGDDNVDISLLHDSDGCKYSEISNRHQVSIENSSSKKTNSDMSPTNIISFSFEAQVVSLELTFYDGTKAFVDDAMHIEKLLRAKMDLSFMFASKENDMWVKSLVKDLTVESGSGLVVLDPVDISGGYTSVKEKTNISLILADICLHLPLSVASLILNLQNQALAALQIGNLKPMVSCTNFQRIWVSMKGGLPGYGLTFWRPQAPANYAVLGDCVTSRPIPPSQVVMALSNTYGRVKRPIAFELVFCLSDTVASDEGNYKLTPESECSIWMPIAPPGYSAIGCVAHFGRQPPPAHIVYCIRSDLVTSATFSECIFSIKPNSRLSCGASVWRVDNAISSFYAHISMGCPPKIKAINLHQIIMCHHDNYPVTSRFDRDDLAQNRQCDQLKSQSDGNLTGWDVLRSLSKSNFYMSTPHFERIWWDRGSDYRRAISIWRPIPRQGFSVLGDCLVEGLEPPALGLTFKSDTSEISAKPMQFTKVAHIERKGSDEAYFWYPIAPPGYASLGCVVTKTEQPPDKDAFCCPRMDFVNQTNIPDSPISRSSTSKGSGCWSIWKVENQTHTFFARSDHKKPSIRLAYTIADHLKPKTRENISAEMKLGFFSLTVLDDSYGMMTPLFDTTVTNIKLVTHGRLEAMNAVLVCSLAASTFNRQLEAWEPIVEPFDGIFKVETYDYSDHPSRVGKRVRLAATSIVNLNLSSGHLETLVESLIAWRKLEELQLISNKTQESFSGGGYISDSRFSALDDDDDGKKIILENILGSDLYIKKVEQGLETTELVVHGSHSCISVPPPRFSDRLNVVAESRESRYCAAIHIFQAKGLPITDDGNGHEFFCALRLVLGSNTSDKHKLFPQSARTRCVRPVISNVNGTEMANVNWNELFLFELPGKGLTTLELEVTNLASKAGKGEIIGALSIPIKTSRTALKRIGSVRMLLESANDHCVSTLPLKRRGQQTSSELDYGTLQISTSIFERNTIPNQVREMNSSTKSFGDTGFWVGLAPEGPWESFGSLLPLSVIPRSLAGRQFAFEVSIRDGVKHAVLRPLAMVINETDVKLELSLCSAFLSESSPRDKEQLDNNSRNVFATIGPSSSTVLPWSSLVTDNDKCLQIRPYAESPDSEYNWSQAFTVNSSGKPAASEGSSDYGPLYRQNTMRNSGNLQLSASLFKLNQFEKNDVLLYCNSTSGGTHNICLSAGTDASVLHTEINTPVYDWKININAPLRIENKLPYQAEYIIWEKTTEGNNLERQHGTIPSEGTVFVYSADLRRPIYLSLLVQGCWTLEKDSVLVMDLASQNHASFFWMIHEQSNRRLRVNIERDIGGTIAAPKIVRFFVPYWITNESSIPLSYRIVEVDPSDHENVDSPLISKAVRSAKSALRHTSSSVGVDRRSSQLLEVIEDSDSSYIMFSPQDYMNRTGVMQFQPRNESSLSQRVGISVAVRNSEIYRAGVSLYELENKERVDVRAFQSDGSYYRLSAMLNMASDRTKVIHFQPRTLFVNRIGQSICLKQSGSELEQWLQPADLPNILRWSNAITKLVELRVDGYKWSTPFSIENEGIMCICLKNQVSSDLKHLWVEVRSGVKISRNEVIFRLASFSSPYRIENRCMTKQVKIRQTGGSENSWQYIPPNSSASFCWEDLGRRQLLEVLVDGTDPSKSESYIIDEIRNHFPLHTDDGSEKEICLTTHKEGKILVSRISEWTPDQQNMLSADSSLMSSSEHSERQNSVDDCEFHLTCELTELGISIVDHMPEELLYISIQNFLFSYSTGLGSGMSRFKLRMHGFQIDNQIPYTPMPVLFRPQKTSDETDYVAKFSLSMQSSATADRCIYPYVGIQGPESSAFLVNIHEPIIWRLHEMIRQAKLNRIYRSESTAVSVDPIIHIGFLNLSEFRFRVSMAMSPTQRPGGVLGFWYSLMTALGNMENMTVRVNQRSREDITMRQSALISSAMSSIQKDVLSQPLRLLSGVDILGNASSALGHMSKGVAALSMDKKFIQSRQKQDKGVEDIGDVIREGGGAFAKGLFRGVTGILTKPLEGAKSSGVEGFVQGVGKGIIGAAAQPVSGVLDLLSKTTEGANAVRMKIASAIMSEEQLLRRRLPRVIGGDNLLKPYDEFKAVGQAILQLAECSSFFGQGDLFKVRGKFALSDAYEDHFLLPKGKFILVTHRRVILLQQPTHIVTQRRFNPARDPCSVLWDVSWDDLVTMELAHGKKEPVQSPPSRLILYLQIKPTESKECALVVKCAKDSQQALNIYTAIDRAINSYGPNRAKETLRMQTKPYSPYGNVYHSQVYPKENYGFPSIPDVPASLSTFGSMV